jgi:hypothetical protein
MSEASLPALRRVPDVGERAIEGETILVPIRTNPRQKVSVLTLDEVGTFIWDALREEQTVRSLAVAISEAFEVSVEQATADVVPFLQQLRSWGLVLELS